MTDDIVERLRKYSSAIFLACHKDVADDISPKLIEAADEIEELRAALDEVRAELLLAYERAWEKEAKP